ncbi:MAG: glycolate oxidase subunit GlcE [Thiotrichales bacterium]|nr:glycolate oxidase subunit GlcE [Thiotrichales bacterium]
MDYQDIAEQVRAAYAAKSPLVITAGNSKSFYGHPCTGTPLDVTPCSGIHAHEPSELVITAAAGTPYERIEQVLAEHNQYLPFDAPVFTGQTTLGGVVASGLAGPRRPWSGAVRDFVLGVRCVNGRGEVLKFGGQVIKNVAGYDLSRLLTGSLGTLAVILEVSLKLVPKPPCEVSLVETMPLSRAMEFINAWSVQPAPLSGACYLEGVLHVRLSGFDAAVMKTAKDMGLQQEGHTDFWERLRHQQLPFFDSTENLWRVSIPAACHYPDLPGERLVDWGGALHWLRTSASAQEVRQTARALGGHATLYRTAEKNVPRFQPLPEAMTGLHQRIRSAFDPAGILNVGRMYPE